MPTPIYHDTLGSALDAAYQHAIVSGGEIHADDWDALVAGFGPVPYEDARRGSVPLRRYRGRLNTLKVLYIVVYRMQSGRYELTCYLS